MFLGPSDAKISTAITELRHLVLDIEDQGHPADYVGVAIKRRDDGSIELTQRALIDTIIEDRRCHFGGQSRQNSSCKRKGESTCSQGQAGI